MKIFSSLKLLLFIFPIFLVISCKVRRPSDVIPENTMENLLYDYHIAKALSENLPYNENYKKALYLEAVFEKYNITETEFDSSMVWYTRNVEVLANIYDRLNKRAKSKQNEYDRLIALRDKKPMISQPGDSVDVWAWKQTMRLHNVPLYMNFSFILPADSNFKQCDIFEWTAHYDYLENLPDSSLAAVMAMQIVYVNDSISGATKLIYNTGFDTLRLMGQPSTEIREVRGFLYYPITNSENELLIDKLALMRYRANDTITIDSLQNTDGADRIMENQSGIDSSAANKPSVANEPMRRLPQTDRPLRSNELNESQIQAEPLRRARNLEIQ